MKRKKLVLQNPKPTLKMSIDVHNSNADFTYQVVCLNNTNQDITIVFRDNLPITYHRPTTPSIGDKEFVVRKTYTFSGHLRITEVANNLHTLMMNEKDNVISEDLTIIYKALHDYLRMNSIAKFTSIAIDREVDLKQLEGNNGCYLSELDIMVYDGKYRPDMIHPYSIKAKSQNAFNDLVEDHNCLGITVEIVDNEDMIAARYMYFADRVFEMPIKKDGERHSGVYLTSNDRGAPRTEYCTLEDMANRFGIQPTAEEAITGGNPELIHKNRLRELDIEANVSKAQQQIEISESKRELLKLQEKQERIALEQKQRYEELSLRLKREAEEQKLKNEEELTRIKREHEEQMLQLKRNSEVQRLNYEDELRSIERRRHKTKDHYEEKSYRRKDDHESLKNFGIVASIGLGLFAVLKKS